LRAEGVDCHRRGKDRRAREESGELRTELGSSGAALSRPVSAAMPCTDGTVKEPAHDDLVTALGLAVFQAPKTRRQARAYSASARRSPFL
ncbi:MAG: hypothetical protein M3259_10180, partial [Actinomycetota bacterium]|nr:hypothetical protein [Actinomycetota bacterium]